MAYDQTLILNYNILVGLFDFNSLLIETDGADALLKKIDETGQEFQQDFASDSGFTYDSSLAEFVGNKLQQKDKSLNSNVLSWATYTSSINLSGAGGSQIGTAIGGASVLGNRLNLKGGVNQYVDYDAVGNFDSQQTGTIRQKFTPNYSSLPPSVQIYFELLRGDGDRKNRISLTHRTVSGDLILEMRDKDDVILTSHIAVSGWNPTAGVTYEIEISWDLTAGANRVFIDGILQNGTNTVTGVRDSNIGLFRVGANYVTDGNPDFEVEDLIYFSTVQHSSNYTPGYTLEEAKYLESKIDCPIFTYSDLGNLQAWESLAATIANDPQFIHNSLYYNGSTWVSSDGSFTQSNTLAEVQNNIDTLPAVNTIIPSIVFSESNIQQNIDLYRLFYTGQKYSVASPWIEITSATYLDGVGVFTIELTTPTNTSLSYSLNINGIIYYHNGSNWVMSDGTAAQSNTLADLNTNINSFDFGLGRVFKLRVFLITTDDQVTPKLFKTTMTYDFSVAPSYPPVCRMYGFITDVKGQPMENATIVFNSVDFYIGANAITKSIKVTSDANGYYESDLIKTADYNIEMEQVITYTEIDGSEEEKIDKFTVPNLASAAIADHLAA